MNDRITCFDVKRILFADPEQLPAPIQAHLEHCERCRAAGKGVCLKLLAKAQPEPTGAPEK